MSTLEVQLRSIALQIVREMIWTCTEIMIHWTKGAKYGVSRRRGGGSWMK